jgi:hypothetical protein
MMTSRFAAAVLAGSFVVAPAVADEYTTFQNLEITSAAFPECRTGMLLNLPPSWRMADGAVVLLSMGPLRDAARDSLVSALLFEHAAVLELVPCGARYGGDGSVTAGALGALDAMSRTMGAGLVVAIGYGPGGTAVLDVVREPVASLLGVNGPRYAAAIAIGDGAPVLMLGAPLPAWEQAPPRLAALCRALAAVAGGMGPTPERIAPATAGETCGAATAGDTLPATTPHPATSRR